MKKKVLAGLLASMSLFGVVFSGSTSFAAPIDDQDTDVTIGFSGHSPGTSGPLEFKWKPDKFDFGSSNAVNAVPTAFSEDTGLNKHVVVSDDRTAAAANEWKVTVELSQLLSGASQLTGAVLNFDATKMAYNGTQSPEIPGSITAPTAAHTATVVATQSLGQGDAAVTAMSDSGPTGAYKGMTAMEISTIELDVPQNVAQSGKQYAGTVTWTLEDAI